MDTSLCEEERIDAGKEEEIKSTEGEQSSPQGAQQPLLLWVVYQEGDSLLECFHFYVFHMQAACTVAKITDWILV